MEITPMEKRFHVLPVLTITKTINTLTAEAKVTFNYNWSDYYSVIFGWGKWIYKYDVR